MLIALDVTRRKNLDKNENKRSGGCAKMGGRLGKNKTNILNVGTCLHAYNRGTSMYDSRKEPPPACESQLTSVGLTCVFA